MTVSAPRAPIGETPRSSGPESPEAAPDKVSIQYILVSWRGILSSVTRSKPEAQDRAKEVAQRAKRGEDFTSLAKQDSDDPGTRDRGGDLGMIERGTHVKAFTDTAFSLDVGQVSEPVETTFGFCIIKRNR